MLNLYCLVLRHFDKLFYRIPSLIKKKKVVDRTSKTLLWFVNVTGVMQQQEEVQKTAQEQTKHYEIWRNQSGAQSWRLLACDTMYLPKQLSNQATDSVSNQPLLQVVHQIDAQTHPPSYSTGTAAPFLAGKVAGTWIWPFITIQCRGNEWVELYLHSPSMLSRCAQGQLYLLG